MQTKIVGSGKMARRSLVILFAVMGIFFLSGTAMAVPAKHLNIFIWSQYMKPQIIKQFEKKYGVRVTLTYYNSLGSMFAKLRSGGDSEYDIVVPSNYFVPKMIKSDILQPLNKKLIPNLKNIMKRFKNPPYDPGNKYTAAYQWGTTGIAYDATKLHKVPDIWAVLFDPKVNSKFPFVLSADPRVMLGAACAYQGHGYACIGAKKWKQAAKLILKTKKRPNFNGFMDDTRMLKQIARGNLVAGVAYNGDLAFDKVQDPKTYAHIKFILPKEGAELWVDNMAIPVHAPHPNLANEFINFILNPKIGAELSNYNDYATPNKASVPYLIPALKKPPVLPSKEAMKRLHFTPSLEGKQLQLVQQLWTAVQSQ
jgi:spermidine/putrescine transport system substrate-binding protein